MWHRRRLILATTVAALGGVLALPLAAEDYPEKPITLIVPLGAGGSHDLNARVMTSILPTYLDQPVVVKLMPGASGQTGTAAAASAPADGYTLLFSHNYIDQLQQHVGDLPYKPLEDFVPVVRLNAAPLSIVVRADAPWQTLDDMMAYAKGNPDKLRFGHSGNWGAIMVPGAQLLASAGATATFTPYQGGGPVIQGLLAGDVDYTMAFPSVIDAQGDKIRVLATAADERLYPDVPTLKELGYAQDVSAMDRIVLAPAGIAPERLAKLREAFAALQEDKTYTSMMAKMGEDPSTFLDGEAYQALRARQSEDYKKLIDEISG
jgi:tripartite-type tricarboxylate transporter receptor subunit TctC